MTASQLASNTSQSIRSKIKLPQYHLKKGHIKDMMTYIHANRPLPESVIVIAHVAAVARMTGDTLWEGMIIAPEKTAEGKWFKFDRFPGRATLPL